MPCSATVSYTSEIDAGGDCEMSTFTPIEITVMALYPRYRACDIAKRLGVRLEHIKAIVAFLAIKTAVM